MSRQRRRGWALVNVGAALLVTIGLVVAGARGAGPLPPLGPAFNPGTGVWTMAASAQLPKTETLAIAGLDKPVRVLFEANGLAHIDAATNHDLFLTMGYLHARFRLFQMDLMRRQGEGLLSQVVGAAALPTDKFELQLGLLRTAQLEWSRMKDGDPARNVLQAYTAGVNDVIAQDRATGRFPVMFKLLGYRPTAWKPVDSLVIQGDMTQDLDYFTGALQYALLVHSLGYKQTMKWFPILPVNEQHPYDPGPYVKQGVTPIPAQVTVSAGEASAVATVLTALHNLPASAIHQQSNSNNWAVDGTRTAWGKPLMAGDPHLDQTLPAIWYQLQAVSPGYHFSGVSIPGLPIIVIGRNDQISWSLTNTQNEATLYYQEKTDARHPDEYFWQGQWHRMTSIEYAIPVKGRGPVAFSVHTTVHGPVITQAGQTLSVDWMGALPSADLDALLGVVKATNFTQFRNALRVWHAPSQNFIYADHNGHIGLISAGYYPIVRHGQPWLPLSGTGADDVVGTIPFDAIPQVYDPPSHLIFTANQRVVGPDYPYYIGNMLDFFDAGYRADEIYHTLTAGHHLTVADMARLQNDTHDYLARVIVPKVLVALRGASLDPRATQVRSLLQSWDADMSVHSVSATVWMSFWQHYLQDTFEPWWQHDRVPVHQDDALRIQPAADSTVGAVLGADLQAWTLHDQTNPAFTLPDGTHRTATDVMRLAFTQAVTELSRTLGPDPTTWQWGRVHSREFPSLSQAPSLAYGPRPSGGDAWTVDAATGNPATAGPSWRFIMDWSNGQGLGVYPGGQAENPLSPWYENRINTWWNGRYDRMFDLSQTTRQPGVQTWTLAP